MSAAPYPASARLGETFFAHPVEDVAEALLGKVLVHRDREGLVALRLVEVEAYRGEGQDEASHAHRGPTPRNHQMFETPGRLYVYLCYGVHHCLNVVCEAEGRAAAVLLRGAEVLSGGSILARRRGHAGYGIANGPGTLAQALGADLGWDGRSLLAGETGFWPGPSPGEIRQTTRIGISRGRSDLLRFFDPASRCVSRARPVL
ncbi:DNA-3-methyladenine glycosylase [bacterium]|nr:MAG: DNA-3-methyladenine glycosylase [bacterium]